MSNFFREILWIIIEMQIFLFEQLYPDNIIWMYRQNGLIFTIFGIVIILATEVALVGSELLIIYGLFYGLYKLIRMLSIMVRTKETNRYIVQGTITKKEYESSYTTYTYTGKVLVPIYHDL